MAEAKIDFKVGAVSFIAEGSEKWLSDELSRVLEKVPELTNVATTPNSNGGITEVVTNGQQKPKGSAGPLAGYLSAKNASDNQRRKFLATAAWLHDKTGESRLTTGQVKKALRDNSQGKLTNASASLNDNVAKGHCEKDGKTFFVTDAGRALLA